MGRAQAKCAAALSISPELAGSMQSYIARHYAALGLGFDPKLVSLTDGEEFSGTADRYAKIRAFGLPGSVERFFLGSEATFCARRGIMPEPPLEYLALEPSFLDVIKSRQDTADRTATLWRIQ
jgi:hypothetical protein